MKDIIRVTLDKNMSMANNKLYEEKNYEEAIEYAVKAIQCAELINDQEEIIEGNLLLGHSYLNSMKNLKYAAQIYYNTLDKFEDFNFGKEHINYIICNHALGRTLRKLGRLDEAIRILEKVAKSKIDNLERKVRVLNDLGLTYWRQAHVKGQDLLKKAIKIYDSAIENCHCNGFKSDDDYKDYKAILLNNKGMVFYDLEDYNSSIISFKKALELTDDTFYIACIGNEIAKTYLKLGNFHMSKKFINKSNKILIDFEDEQAAEIELLRNLAIEGLYQRRMGNFEDAVHYFEMAVNKIEDKELRIEAAETFHQLSLMLKERGDIRSGRYALKFEELAKEIEEEEKKVSSI